MTSGGLYDTPNDTNNNYQRERVDLTFEVLLDLKTDKISDNVRFIRFPMDQYCLEVVYNLCTYLNRNTQNPFTVLEGPEI